MLFTIHYQIIMKKLLFSIFFSILIFSSCQEENILSTSSHPQQNNALNSRNSNSNATAFSLNGVLEETGDEINAHLNYLDWSNQFQGTSNLYGPNTYNVSISGLENDKTVEMIRYMGNSTYRVTTNTQENYLLTNVFIQKGLIQGNLKTSNSLGTVNSHFSIVSNTIASDLNLEYIKSNARVGPFAIIAVIGGIITTASCAYERSAARAACHNSYNSSQNACGCNCTINYIAGICGGTCEINCP